MPHSQNTSNATHCSHQIDSRKFQVITRNQSTEPPFPPLIGFRALSVLLQQKKQPPKNDVCAVKMAPVSLITLDLAAKQGQGSVPIVPPPPRFLIAYLFKRDGSGNLWSFIFFTVQTTNCALARIFHLLFDATSPASIKFWRRSQPVSTNSSSKTWRRFVSTKALLGNSPLRSELIWEMSDQYHSRDLAGIRQRWGSPPARAFSPWGRSQPSSEHRNNTPTHSPLIFSFFPYADSIASKHKCTSCTQSGEYFTFRRLETSAIVAWNHQVFGSKRHFQMLSVEIKTTCVTFGLKNTPGPAGEDAVFLCHPR